MLWSSTTRVGCGGAYGDEAGTRTVYIVCRYSPQGNDYSGSALLENVHALKESKYFVQASSIVSNDDTSGFEIYYSINILLVFNLHMNSRPVYENPKLIVSYNQ